MTGTANIELQDKEPISDEAIAQRFEEDAHALAQMHEQLMQNLCPTDELRSTI